MEAKYTTVDSHRVGYFDEGQGTPLVIVHGFMNTKEGLEKVVDTFSPSMRVIVPDLPGYGESEVTLKAESLMEFADFLHDFIQKLDLEKVNMFGTSFGGTVAMLFALKYQDLLNKLILRASLYHWSQIPKIFRSEMVRGLIKDVTKFRPLRRPLVNLTGYIYPKLVEKRQSKRQTPENMERIRRTIRIWKDRLKEEDVQIMTRNGLINMLYTDLTDELPKINNETLVVWKKKDIFVSGKSGRYLQENIPNSKYVEMDGESHSVIYEDLTELTKSVNEFLGMQV